MHKSLVNKNSALSSACSGLESTRNVDYFLATQTTWPDPRKVGTLLIVLTRGFGCVQIGQLPNQRPLLARLFQLILSHQVTVALDHLQRRAAAILETLLHGRRQIFDWRKEVQATSLGQDI